MLAGAYALQLSSFPLAVLGACVTLLLWRRRWRLLAFFLLGTTLFLLTALAVIDTRLAPEFEGDSMLTTVRVVDFPRHTGASVALVVEPLDDSRLPRRSRVSWFEPPLVPVLGDTWQLEVRLRRPRGNANPGAYDYESWLFRDRVGATGYIVPGSRNVRLASGQGNAIDGFRQRLAGRITAVVTDADTAAVLVAIALGSRHLLTDEQWQRFARTGTSHLMAISGLHVGLAALAMYFVACAILAAAGTRFNNHRIALVLSFCLAAAYVLMSGFAVPAQRALLMLGLATIALLRRRSIRGDALLAAACIVVVVANPLATMQPGFMLSFAAVALLIWHARRFGGRRASPPGWRKAGAAAAGLVTIQFVLLPGLFPLTVVSFDRVALLAPFANVLAVPLFSFVTVPATLAGAFASWDGGLEVAAASLRLLDVIVSKLAALGIADLVVADLGATGALLAALPLVWAVLPPGWPGRYAAWPAFIAAVLWQPATPAFGCVVASFLDVGQGLSVVLQTRNSVILYDTGPSYPGGGSAAQRYVLPYLRSRGVRRIDKLFVSHADLDHAGGAADIAAALDVAELIVGEPLADIGQATTACVAGAAWTRDGVDFSIVHPPSAASFSGNDASCVLRVDAGRHGLLLSGDIESVAERYLASAGLLRAADVASVPHHGSGTSSSLPFVERVSPDIAIVAAGHNNRWGFPKPDVRRRWRSQGARVLQTSANGAISLSLCQRGGVSDLRLHRERYRRLWHEP